MPRENARTRKREFHSNQFTKNAKKNRVSDEDKTDGKPSTSSDNMWLPPPEKLANEVRQ